jgi:hypothetical protein
MIPCQIACCDHSVVADTEEEEDASVRSVPSVFLVFLVVVGLTVVFLVVVFLVVVSFVVAGVSVVISLVVVFLVVVFLVVVFLVVVVLVVVFLVVVFFFFVVLGFSVRAVEDEAANSTRSTTANRSSWDWWNTCAAVQLSTCAWQLLTLHKIRLQSGAS